MVSKTVFVLVLVFVGLFRGLVGELVQPAMTQDLPLFSSNCNFTMILICFLHKVPIYMTGAVASSRKALLIYNLV